MVPSVVETEFAVWLGTLTMLVWSESGLALALVTVIRVRQGDDRAKSSPPPVVGTATALPILLPVTGCRTRGSSTVAVYGSTTEGMPACRPQASRP